MRAPPVLPSQANARATQAMAGQPMMPAQAMAGMANRPMMPPAAPTGGMLAGAQPAPGYAMAMPAGMGVPQPAAMFKKGGVVKKKAPAKVAPKKYAKGGSIDGCAVKGKTRGRMV